jgi:1,4-dihydroxy-2-naphthoate octaprenyltransferase
MQPTTDPASPLTRRELWVRLLLYPTHTFPTAAAPVLVGVGLAIHDSVFDFWPAFVGFIASWLLHVGGVFIDNYELLVRHADNREHPELIEAVRNGTLSLGILRGAIVFCYLAAIMTGPYVYYIAGPLVVFFGLLGVLSSWAYAGGPLAYARLGLADPIFFLMFGIVAVVGTYYVQAAAHGATIASALPLDAFLLGLPVGGLITNVLLIDDMRDREPDRDKGWRTGAVRFGLNWNRVEIVALTAFAYIAPFWFWLGRGYGAWVLLPLATLPRGIAVARAVCRSERFEELFPMTPKGAFLSLYYGALLGLGIVLGRLI